MQVRHSHDLSANASAARRMTRAGARGFTLIELLVVIAIIMVFLISALPTIASVISNSRVRGQLTSVSTMAQVARSTAVRDNTVKSISFVQSQSAWFAYTGAPGGALSAADSKAALGGQIKFMLDPTGTNAPSALSSTTAFGNSNVVVSAKDLSFNPRGMPCRYNTGVTPPSCDWIDKGSNKVIGYIWYFTFSPPFGQDRWGAVSISPAGRVKTWMWNGSAWGN